MLLKGGRALAGGGWAFDDGKLMTDSQLNLIILAAGTRRSWMDRERVGWPCEPCRMLMGYC